MIILDKVHLTHPHLGAPILHNASALIGPRERVGILAAPGSGKSSIARLLCGVDAPSGGTVQTQATSWPLGFAGFFHPHLSVAANLRFLAKLTGQNAADFVARVVVLAKLEDHISHQLRNLSPTQRSTLAYMSTMATPAQTIIADDTLTVGDTPMQARCEAILRQRLRTDGLIFLTRNVRQVTQFCDRYYALSRGRLIPCTTPALAQSLATQETENA